MEEISICEITGIDDDGTEILSKIVEILGTEINAEDRAVAVYSLTNNRVKEQYRQLFIDATEKLIEGLLELSKVVPGDRSYFRLMGAIGENIVVATPSQ